LIFTKALPLKFRALWFAGSIVSSIWFLYWICYDILIWNKALTEARTANYVGLIVSIALAIVGTQFGKLGFSKKLMVPVEQKVNKEIIENQKAPEGKQIEHIEQKQQIQPAKEVTKQVPLGSSVPNGCKFYLGYLHKRPVADEIPEECLGCEHVVECLSPTAVTIKARK